LRPALSVPRCLTALPYHTQFLERPRSFLRAASTSNRDGRHAEITHQRAFYAVVFVDRRGIYLRSGGHPVAIVIVQYGHFWGHTRRAGSGLQGSPRPRPEAAAAPWSITRHGDLDVDLDVWRIPFERRILDKSQ
jgi:hypothetical protein